MKYYNSQKKYEVDSHKNPEESETRYETINMAYFDSTYLNIRNIHNKKKEHR